MVAVGTAIVKGVPVPTTVPVPQAPLYQVNVPPDPPVAVRIIFPVALEQIIGLSTDADVGITGAVFTVTVVLAQEDDVHPAIPHDA